ncbi:MAG: NAD(P)-binding domain-containing protein [Bacteroidetes bacterium]|nr:NAD(P)-binding domain-containing protein [Bacteroidota bacterium]HET6243611.1 3-hydroxyacyl-CoA dehydrogenase NAD-binding domain-containing protein [Bacteroidia bacterium]
MEFTKSTVIGVIGSGAMGAGIAQVAATSGHRVVLFDSNNKALEKSKNNLSITLEKLIEKGKIDQETAQNIFKRIVFAHDMDSFKNCGIVIEAIVENLDVKQAVFHHVETIVTEDCVLASNTSSLSIASIASACEKPQRVLGIHFFNPAPVMPLVEIIPAISTNEVLLIETKKLIDSWGKTTVLAKDTPGFIVNRIARPFYSEAIRIHEEGIADFATIDWAMKEIGGFRMGPFELMDFIGNDINYKVTETIWEQFFYDPRYKPSLTQKRLFEAKHFGKKAGKGYYDYSPNAIVLNPDKNFEKAEAIFLRIFAMLVNEAADALFWQVASKEDIDLAMVKGVNYPKGLLSWADEIGLDKVVNLMENLRKEYNEDRYRTSTLLKQMLKNGINFYS